MTLSRGKGPPTDDDGAPHHQDATHVEGLRHPTTDSRRLYRRRGIMWRCPPQDTVSQMKRRREATGRMEGLDCGCRDPWVCDCTEPPLSTRTVDGYRDAALHILESNRVPIVQIEVLQALWRRGGADRELAELLHKLTSGQVA